MKMTVSQMQRFGQISRLRFADSLALRLRTGFPDVVTDRGLSDQSIVRIAEQIIEVAYGFGIRDEADVKTFLDCLMTLGPAFDSDPRYPWAGEILNRQDLSGNQKMTLLHDHIVFARRS